MWFSVFQAKKTPYYVRVDPYLVLNTKKPISSVEHEKAVIFSQITQRVRF